MTDTEIGMAPVVPLHEIGLLTARLGLQAFGGGMSGMVYQEVVTKRRWLTEEEFLSGLAVCQVIPGVNIANLVVYVGQHLRGAPGAAAALLGLLLGPFFFVIGAGAIYSSIKDIETITAGLSGITAAAMGVVLMVVVRGSMAPAQRGPGLVIIAAVLVSIGFLHWPLFPVVLLLAPVSVGLAWLRIRRHG